MRLFLLLVIVLSSFEISAQTEEFFLQARAVDTNGEPVGDAHVFNGRSSFKSVSRSNGVFDVWVLPGDSVIITHISYIRKVVTVHQLMINPLVQLEPDTINIKTVNVSANQQTYYERALKNMNMIEFDFRQRPGDSFSDSERMKMLMQNEDRVQRITASSVSFFRFSPSDEIDKIISKHLKKKEARQFSSTREKDLKE